MERPSCEFKPPTANGVGLARAEQQICLARGGNERSAKPAVLSVITDRSLEFDRRANLFTFRLVSTLVFVT